MGENNNIVCKLCGNKNDKNRYFCSNCGEFLYDESFANKKTYEFSQIKVMRIIENLKNTPHIDILWNDTIDLYTRKVEKFKALYSIPEMGADRNSELCEKMIDFLDLCYKPEFQIAFVGTIKTGKSTLINSLLGRNYASMAVTPETAALTKFRSSPRDYVNVTFYSKQEWKKLWDSRTSAADAFMNEYKELEADKQKNKWVGHKDIHKELLNSEIEDELAIWSSSKRAEHYFVKEIEVGISTLPKEFPKQVVFVDTPGLSDPVSYRSEITKQYIRKANAVFVCVDAQKVQKDEIETISSVFSFSSHNKSKVHIIATHWDKLNNPEKDWKEQKAWLEKRLIGKGFFDSKEMAHENIMHSAAYIYNLCRDYDKISQSEKMPLIQLSIAFGLQDLSLVDEYVPKLMKISNIENINKIIKDKLAENYKSLLYQDIEKKYEDIVFNLKRIANETKDEMKELIDVSKADMDKMKEKVDEQKQNYDEVSKCKQELSVVLNSFEKSTDKRLKTVISEFEKLNAGSIK